MRCARRDALNALDAGFDTPGDRRDAAALWIQRVTRGAVVRRRKSVADGRFVAAIAERGRTALRMSEVVAVSAARAAAAREAWPDAHRAEEVIGAAPRIFIDTPCP